MLELGTGANAASQGDLIKDSSEATFMVDVIEASQDVPVIVDFWATWCGPCKTLGPILESAVRDAGGKVKMVKIDVDQNRGITEQLRVQSMPTVFAFYKGQPVDAFQGALPGSEVKAFIDKAIELSGGAADGGLAEAVEVAETMLEEGAAADAAQTFAAVLGEEPGNAAAYSGLIRAHIAMDEADQAQSLLDNAPEEIAGTPELEAVKAQLELLKQAANAGPVAELQAQVDADPSNHQARFDLATAMHAAGDAEGAVDQLLEIFRQDRDWSDGAAKAQLFTIFDALKAEDPVVLKGRRKLSSLIFA